MMKWFVILLIAVGAYFAWQNWPSLSKQMRQVAAQVPSTLRLGTMKVAKPDGTSATVSVSLSSESWVPREVGGLRINLPFELQAITDTMSGQLPPGVQYEGYVGKSLAHEIAIWHLSFPTARSLPLWIFNISQGPAANRLGLQVLPKNPPTLLNGFRAQRTDCVTTATPKLRYRMLLLERGSQAWLIETHAMENDSAFEPSFQKMAFSAQPL